MQGVITFSNHAAVALAVTVATMIGTGFSKEIAGTSLIGTDIAPLRNYQEDAGRRTKDVRVGGLYSGNAGMIEAAVTRNAGSQWMRSALP